MTDQLTIATRHIDLASTRHRRVMETARNRRTWLRGLHGLRQYRQEFVITLGHIETPRRPGRPFAVLGQAREAAADEIAAVIATPFRITEFVPTQLDARLLARIHQARGATGYAELAFLAVLLLLGQGLGRNQLRGRHHGAEHYGGAVVLRDHVAREAEPAHPRGRGQIAMRDVGQEIVHAARRFGALAGVRGDAVGGDGLLLPIVGKPHGQTGHAGARAEVCAVGGRAESQLGVKLASAVILALPIFIAYMFFQKYYIQSMASSGLKE